VKFSRIESAVAGLSKAPNAASRLVKPPIAFGIHSKYGLSALYWSNSRKLLGARIKRACRRYSQNREARKGRSP
jgi:hypothetical protein